MERVRLLFAAFPDPAWTAERAERVLAAIMRRLEGRRRRRRVARACAVVAVVLLAISGGALAWSRGR